MTRQSMAEMLAQNLTDKSQNGTKFEVLREYKPKGHSITYKIRVSRNGQSMMFPTGNIQSTTRTLALLDDVAYRMGAFTDFGK